MNDESDINKWNDNIKNKTGSFVWSSQKKKKFWCMIHLKFWWISILGHSSSDTPISEDLKNLENVMTKQYSSFSILGHISSDREELTNFWGTDWAV